MAKFLFEMPDDMTTMVEVFRVKRGHKATAQAVRELISTGMEVAGSMLGQTQITPAAEGHGRTIRVQIDHKTIVDRHPLVSSPENTAAVAKMGIAASKSWPMAEPAAANHTIPFGPVKRATPKRAK